MNLYNQLMGYAPCTPLVIGLLCGVSIPPENEEEGSRVTRVLGKLPRFRDTHVHVDVGGSPVLTVMTRSGGPNRPRWEKANAWMRQHPFYVRDFDDAYDNTYAYFEFAVPVSVREHVADFIRSHHGDLKRPMDRYLARVEQMITAPFSPELVEMLRKAAHAAEVGAALFGEDDDTPAERTRGVPVEIDKPVHPSALPFLTPSEKSDPTLN